MAFCSWKGEEYYRDHFRSGTYHCVKCNYGLFSSLSKYKHDSRLPSFATPLNKDSLSKVPEKNLRLTLKVSCGKCGNPLGHEFQRDRKDGGSRFGIVSQSLKFVASVGGMETSKETEKKYCVSPTSSSSSSTPPPQPSSSSSSSEED